jgi:hypothetical protein
MSISVSVILGWFLILGLLFSIQDYDSTIASLMGQPVTQIFLDTVSQNGAIVLMVHRCTLHPTPIANPMTFFLSDHHHRRDVLLWVSFDIDFTFTSAFIHNSQAHFLRTFPVTSNLRMMYAFSCDGVIPSLSFFQKVDQRWCSPIRTGLSLSICPTPSFLPSFLLD